MGTGKPVKRIINNPWFVTITGGIIVTGLFYFLLERPDILVEIKKIVGDYITIPRILIIATSVIVIGIARFIQHRRVRLKRKSIEEEIPIPSPISGLCLGRDTELVTLEKELTQKNVILIKGIAGIGKTTLGLKFRNILEEKGYHTLWYQCDSESYEGFLIYLSDYLKNRGSRTFMSLKDQRISGQERLKTA
ncbi:MAG: ATP-binding protein, partial [Theionarchaea archaeon]|nr:ATP-binding protein [Theionarchaea archaeon]